MTTMKMTWYDSVGHECYQLTQLKNRLEVQQKSVRADGHEAQAIWAIESLLEALDVVGRALPNQFHPEVRGK